MGNSCHMHSPFRTVICNHHQQDLFTIQPPFNKRLKSIGKLSSSQRNLVSNMKNNQNQIYIYRVARYQRCKHLIDIFLIWKSKHMLWSQILQCSCVTTVFTVTEGAMALGLKFGYLYIELFFKFAFTFMHLALP